MKNAVLSFFIAVAVAIVMPRDLREGAALAVRAGLALIQLGVALHTQGYDAGPDDPECCVGQDARLTAGAEIFGKAPFLPSSE